MNIEEALEILNTIYESAKASPYIRKPLAHALYVTWKIVKEIEKPRTVAEEIE